jgi:probable phosphoglycerate mutase
VKLILVRHGATAWSVAGQHTGRTDLALLELGRTQATEVGHRVRDLVGAMTPVVYSSPLRRALETADLILGSSCDIVVDGRLREFDYGDFEGLTTAQIRRTWPDWTVFDGCPGGESLAAVEARADSFLVDVREADAGTVVVFAHGHLLRILAARAIGQPGRFGVHLGLDTASVGVIADMRDGPAITLWNETAH